MKKAGRVDGGRKNCPWMSTSYLRMRTMNDPNKRVILKAGFRV